MTATAKAKVLVVAPTSGRRAMIDPNGLRVGWRVTTRDGEPYDLMWGACKPEALDSLLADVRREHGAVDVLRLEQASDLRDSTYYSTPNALAIIERVRAYCHSTFNGGWEAENERRAFHHGVDTALNVVADPETGSRAALTALHRTRPTAGEQNGEPGTETVEGVVTKYSSDEMSRLVMHVYVPGITAIKSGTRVLVTVVPSESESEGKMRTDTERLALIQRLAALRDAGAYVTLGSDGSTRNGGPDKWECEIVYMLPSAIITMGDTWEDAIGAALDRYDHTKAPEAQSKSNSSSDG